MCSRELGISLNQTVKMDIDVYRRRMDECMSVYVGGAWCLMSGCSIVVAEICGY